MTTRIAAARHGGVSVLPPLRPYQLEPLRAIITSVREAHGRTITVEVARQGGKNELSARVELALLAAAAGRGGDAVKCAPTHRPQLHVSMRRLWMRLTQAGVDRAARREPNAIALGRARVLFLSAAPGASVVGHTASLLLEVDEAQDVDEEKFDREFRPMAATTHATTVMYGTPWDDATLLERTKQQNLEAERADGERRHFAYDWEHVARYVPAYAAHVAAERERLGETHPAFLTQYCLKPVSGEGRLFSATQRAQLEGQHERIAHPTAGERYIAGLDLAGGDDTAAASERDATVLTIGRLVDAPAASVVQEPRVEIVEHCAWTGVPHESLLPRLIDLLRDVWRVRCAAIDATGLGETSARLIGAALGEGRMRAVKFTPASKSELAFGLLAAVNGGRLKCYRGDGSPEHREFWREAERAKAAYRANRTMNFYVEERDGHDDYVVSAALLVHASEGQRPRVAVGRVRDGFAG